MKGTLAPMKVLLLAWDFPPTRGGIQTWLLELARRRQVDLILVWRIDRAFRSVLDGAQTLASLRAWGCGLRSLQEPWIDTTTPMGEALFHNTVVWAQLERQTIAERVRAGMDRARAEGKHVGRPRRTTPITQHRQWPRVVEALEAGLLTRGGGGAAPPRPTIDTGPCVGRRAVRAIAAPRRFIVSNPHDHKPATIPRLTKTSRGRRLGRWPSPDRGSAFRRPSVRLAGRGATTCPE